MIWRKPLTNGVLFLSLGLAGCATTETYKPIHLPAFAGAFFSECSARDGSVSVETYSYGKVQQIFDADWNSDASGDWGVASYSPLGQTLFQVDFSHKQQSFKQMGNPFEELKDLGVSNNQILTVNGHEIGIRTDEIACFLNHKIPQRWLKKIVSASENANTINYVILDSKRTIRLALNKHGSRGEEFWTTNIEWNLYWGMKKLRLTVKLLRDEQALVMHTEQFDTIDLRIISQEE